MRRLALLLGVCLGTLSSAAQAQGLASLYRAAHANPLVGNVAAESMISVDGAAYSQLATAIQACPQTCWIIDTFPETFAANPFVGIGSKTVRVTLGRGTWVTNTSLIIPTKSQIEGSGRGDGDFSGTVIRASDSFPAGAAIVEMGNADPSMGVRIENLTIDCNNLPGVIGVDNTQSEEQSGLRHVLIENIAGIGLNVAGSGAQNSGPYEDVELSGGTNSNVTTASLCARFVNVPAFRGMHGATCNFNAYSVHPVVGIQMDSSGTLTDIHIEGADNGIGVGVSGPGTGAILQNIYGGGPNTPNVVHVYRGQNILLSGLVRSTSTNLLVDDVLAQTITDTDLALYIIGNGAPPYQSRFSSSIVPGSESRLADLAVSNLSVLNSIPELTIGHLTVTDLHVAPAPPPSAPPAPSASAIVAPSSAANTHSPTPAANSIAASIIGASATMNTCNGTAILDAEGQAVVLLPAAFNAGDRDIQYQLTPIGRYAPVFVTPEMPGRSFRINGGTPGLKVSWAVTIIP